MAYYKKGPKQIAGYAVLRIETKDGFKLFVGKTAGCWYVHPDGAADSLLCRSRIDGKVQALLKAAREV